MLKNYRGRFPFKLATTSYIYPEEIVPNVVRLGPFFDEIELVLFESGRQDSIPDDSQINHLIELSLLHRVGFNIHLPIDISLGDESEKVRASGVSVVRRVTQKTLRLNPSFYVLHLDPRNKNGREEMDVEAWRNDLAGSLQEILDDGMESKRMAIETLGYPFEWIEDMVKEFGFSICLDIGHILNHGYDLRHYLEAYLPKTSVIHLHGVHNGLDHLGIEALPEPDLDLILSTLHHYHGIVSIEVFSINALKNSLSILEEKWIES
jgi:sugar phosphate isomerase/epimerase